MLIGDVFNNMWNSVETFFFTIWTSIWDAITGSISKLIGWIDSIPGVDLGLSDIDGGDGAGGADTGAPSSLLTPGMEDMFNPAVTAAGKTANIDMQNNITVQVPPGSNTEAIKGAVEEAARAVFTVELQKLFVDTGI